MYSDDDANSDASSACSERSYSSRNGGAIPTYMRQTEDVAEVSSIDTTTSVIDLELKNLKTVLLYVVFIVVYILHFTY